MPSKRSFHKSMQIYKITKTPSFLSKFTANYCSKVFDDLITLFIDDLITLGRSFVKFERNIKLIVTLLDSLGFAVHPNKSIFVPARLTEYLGFVIDSQSMTISLTKKKNVCIR